MRSGVVCVGLDQASFLTRVRMFLPSLNSQRMSSMLFLTRKMPSPPILRSSAERVVSGSSFSRGLYGTPESMKVREAVSDSPSRDRLRPQYIHHQKSLLQLRYLFVSIPKYRLFPRYICGTMFEDCYRWICRLLRSG